MLQTALALASRGLYVFPCKPRDKLPATPRGCRDASNDPTLIARWWSENPCFNIAIACGPASRIFVVDVDDNGEAALRKLEVEHGELPPSVEAITARGRHVYFVWPDRAVRNSVGKLGPGLDVRGDGGYVLAPPSIHPSGRNYCWSVDSAAAFAAAPPWLLDKIAPNKSHDDATPPAVWRALVSDGVAEGQRNDTLTRLAGYLLRRRVDTVVAHEFLKCWNATSCRPPLDDDEVAGIVDSVAACELRRRGAR
jgi:Bifunctional DNA primase/polymerase, N-terminal/Primase C terminal 1 (PriCT-1)